MRKLLLHHNPELAVSSLIVTCPDPVKYGLPVATPASGGVARVENLGTADVWPVFDVAGSVTLVRATLGGRVLEWQGSSTGLHIDARDGIPLTPAGTEVGVLTHDDLFQVGPGVSDIQVATTPAGRSVIVTVRSGWK